MDQKLTIPRWGSLYDDGTLRIVRFAESDGIDEVNNLQRLLVELGPRPTPMVLSPASGQGTVSNGDLGADVIRLAAGDGFVPHTHPGDHLLIVIGGRGTVTYNGKIYPTKAGEIYLINGEVPHAVGAITDHVILAVGSPHKPVDATDRMVPREYESVTATMKELWCLICDKKAILPTRLHDVSCPHCPCETCNPIPAPHESNLR